MNEVLWNYKIRQYIETNLTLIYLYLHNFVCPIFPFWDIWKNIQGDITGIIDENGNSIATYSYDVWGAFGGGSGQINISPIRYRGYYFDSGELSFGGFTKKIGIFY